MNIKYRTGWGPSITEVEIERESEHSVWVKGSRWKKFSNSDQYHTTREDAYQHQVEKYSKRLKSAQAQLEDAKKDYRKVLGLK